MSWASKTVQRKRLTLAVKPKGLTSSPESTWWKLSSDLHMLTVAYSYIWAHACVRVCAQTHPASKMINFLKMWLSGEEKPRVTQIWA